MVDWLLYQIRLRVKYRQKQINEPSFRGYHIMFELFFNVAYKHKCPFNYEAQWNPINKTTFSSEKSIF